MQSDSFTGYRLTEIHSDFNDAGQPQTTVLEWLWNEYSNPTFWTVSQAREILGLLDERIRDSYTEACVEPLGLRDSIIWYRPELDVFWPVSSQDRRRISDCVRTYREYGVYPIGCNGEKWRP
jgi:hypothetical protein